MTQKPQLIIADKTWNYHRELWRELAAQGAEAYDIANSGVSHRFVNCRVGNVAHQFDDGGQQKDIANPTKKPVTK